jgi:hypothetical protein
MCCAHLADAQETPTQFYNRQMADFAKSVNDPSANLRVQRIWLKLVSYSSGTMFPVVPAQNFTLGQALPSGVILLDVSIAGNKDEEVTAFFLAHEWGHLFHQHPLRLIEASFQGPYVATIAGKEYEDEADRYGAQFLKAMGYNVNPVLEFLRSIPVMPDAIHGSGAERASNVAAVYKRTSYVEKSQSHIEYRPCTHPAHLSGDIVPCQHGPMHPGGDIIPCQHMVMTPWGPQPMHSMGDLIPCQHGPAHPCGDLIPCQHPVHPSGDAVRVDDP